MNRLLLLAGVLALVMAPVIASAQDRYVEPPPIFVSPDLSAPWVQQLRRNPVSGVSRAAPVVRQNARAQRHDIAREPVRRATVREPVRRQRAGFVAPMPVAVTPVPARSATLPVKPRAAVHTASAAAGQARGGQRAMDPKFLPREVSYEGDEKPGTIVIDTASKFLYFVEADGTARRYGVGVGKEGFMWKGAEKVSAKREWPGWTPPAEMIARERKKGNILPAHMQGGPANPLGARALYLGDTLYRIHGTNAPWTIGRNVSSGCIRMRNEDVTDLYERVGVGAKVVVM